MKMILPEGWGKAIRIELDGDEFVSLTKHSSKERVVILIEPKRLEGGFLGVEVLLQYAKLLEAKAKAKEEPEDG